jgi:hypothetical protein
MLDFGPTDQSFVRVARNPLRNRFPNRSSDRSTRKRRALSTNIGSYRDEKILSAVSN